MAETLLTGGEAAWHESFDQDTKGWLEARGLTGMELEKALPEIVKVSRGAESKLGVPADQLVRLPKGDDDVDGWKNYLGKLGVPETPEQYELPRVEGNESEFPTEAAKWFHEMGVPSKLARGITEKLLTYSQSKAQAQEEAFNQRADEDIRGLKSEWKADFDKNVELARRVRRTMGLSDEETMEIERAIGIKRAAQMFSSLGKSLGEHRFVGESDRQTFAMSPESARTRIIELQKDSRWMESYMGGDADKKAEWTRLHQIGFPEIKAA